MIKQKYFLSSLDDEYLDLVDLLDDLSMVNSDIKFRKKSNYKYSQSERKSKIDDDKFASYTQAIIQLEEQKKRLEAKIDSFPPLPVLPSPEPLIKISGTVDEITYTKALACFDVGAYTTMQEQLERKCNRDNIGTSVAMVAQVLAGSAPHVGKTDNVWQRDKSMYVQGKIDGKPFAGWVETADVQPGEQVMMAAVPNGDGYMIYAIAVPEKNIVYLPPKCRRSKKSGIISDNIRAIAMMHVVLSPFFIIILFMSRGFLNSFLFIFIASVFLGPIIKYRIDRREGPYWAFFQKIDDVLHLDGYTPMTLWKLKKKRKTPVINNLNTGILMSKGNIRLGDKLTSGGEVINVTSTSIVEGKKIALIGDLVSCPIQGHGINRIVSSEPGWMSDGKAAAFDGALCQCGCRVIASTSTSIMG